MTIDQAAQDAYWAMKSERQVSQEKRARNRAQSAKYLASQNIKFTSRNEGAHLIVEHDGEIVDFWPGTGKWIPRSNKKMERRGVLNLVNYLRRFQQ